MKTSFNKVIGLRRLVYGATALAVSAAAVLPALSGQASAAQVTSRTIQMSSSALGSLTSGQNVSYAITFNVATAGSTQAVIVDFCSNNPLPGTACTAPTGFTVGAGTTTGSIAGMTGTWSGASANSGRTLNLSLATPGGSAAANAAASFTLTTATNPTSAAGTFYARIHTFASAANATTWISTADGSATANVIDSGGVALSTAVQIDLTAKVQETLSFCVYTGGSCGTGSAVALGDTNGVLSSSGHFVDVTTKYAIATNASGSAIVRFKAPLPTSGSNTIASFGTTATAPSTAGASQFGLCTYQSSGSGLSPLVPYNNANCNTTTQTAGTGSTGGTGTSQFAFDTTTAASTYGAALATKTAGTQSVGIVAFAGFANTTQAAGIYTDTFNFIATGTY